MAYSLRHHDLQVLETGSVQAAHASMPEGWRVEPLSPGLGAIIHGIDLSVSLTQRSLNALRGLLLKHEVLFFRQQTMTPQQHRADRKSVV